MSTMSGISLLVSYVMNAVWQVMVVAAGGWLATRLLKRLGPQAEHIGWVATLGIAMVAPAAPLLRRLSVFGGNQLFNIGHSSVVTVTATYAPAGWAGLYQLPVAALWTIAGLYCAVLLYCAGRFSWLLNSTGRMAENAQPFELTREQEEIWERCRRLFGLDGLRMMRSAEIAGPVVLGFKESVVIVPEDFVSRCTLPDLMTALAHECAHASRRDFEKNLCYEAIGVVLAFHPAIWFIKAQIAQTREMVCDSMVAERVLDARTYAKSLLRLAAIVAGSARTSTAHAIGIFDANILEKRIMMMSGKMRHAGFAARYGLIISAALLLASTWIVAAAKAVVIVPAATAGTQHTNANGTVYKVGNGVSAPVVIHSVDAEYPKSYRNVKPPVNATVVVRVVVDKDGMPQDVRVIKSYVPAFDREAVKAVDQFRFKPGMRVGEPVPVAVSVEVNFKWY